MRSRETANAVSKQAWTIISPSPFVLPNSKQPWSAGSVEEGSPRTVQYRIKRSCRSEILTDELGGGAVSSFPALTIRTLQVESSCSPEVCMSDCQTPISSITIAVNEEVLDLSEALQRVEGDQELLSEMTEIFLGEYPGMLAIVQQALSAHDAAALQHAAHALKG